MDATDTKNIFNSVGFRVFNPSDALPFLPAQNHIGSHLLFYAVKQALQTRGLLIDPALLPGCVSGELNRSNYFFFVNHLGNSLKTMEEVLTATTMRCLSTLVYFDFDESCWRIYGHNGAEINIEDQFELAEMQAQQAALTAMIEKVKISPIVPPAPPANSP